MLWGTFRNSSTEPKRSAEIAAETTAERAIASTAAEIRRSPSYLAHVSRRGACVAVRSVDWYSGGCVLHVLTVKGKRAKGSTGLGVARGRNKKGTRGRGKSPACVLALAALVPRM